MPSLSPARPEVDRQPHLGRFARLAASPWASRTLLYAVFVLALGRIRCEVVGANDSSRYATMVAIVERGTFDIREVPLSARTMDKVRVGEQEISSKPPVLSVLGAALYAVMHRVLGLSFQRNEGAVVFGIVAFLCTLPLVVLLWLFHGLLRAEGVLPATALGATALLGLGTLCFPFGTILVNHLPATTALFGAFVLARALRVGRARTWRPALAVGLLASLAVTFELMAAIPVVALTIYVASGWLWPTHKETTVVEANAEADSSPEASLRAPATGRGLMAIAFLVGALLPSALHLWLTFRTTGGVLPVQLRPELWHFSESYWNQPRSWDALAEPKWQYAVGCFFGGRGLLTITPVLGLAFVGIARGLRRGGTFTDGAPPRAESLLVLGATSALALYVVFQTNNYGGGHYGMRWFLVVVPWLFLALVPVIAKWRSTAGRVGLALLVLPGVYTAQIYWFGKPTVYELLAMRWGYLVLPP